ncbi:MAG: hypothetical protein QXD62_01385 [Candidatus Woesearchaeota archaeon]
MKKFPILIGMWFLLAGLLLNTFASEEQVMTETELRLCQTPLGIEIRFETLRRSIEWYLAKTDQIIQYLEERGKDTSKLTEIRNQVMELLNEEIPKDDPELAIEKIIEIKTLMKNLSKMFREELFELTLPEERGEIARMISRIPKPPLDDLKRKIREHNALMIQMRLHRVINEENELIEKYINGELSKKELIDQLRTQVRENLRKNENTRLRILEQIRINQENQIRTELHLRNIAEFKTERVRERIQEKLLNINRTLSNIEKQKRGRQ